MANPPGPMIVPVTIIPIATVIIPIVVVAVAMPMVPVTVSMFRRGGDWEPRRQGKRASGEKIGDFRFHLAFRPMMPSEGDDPHSSSPRLNV